MLFFLHSLDSGDTEIIKVSNRLRISVSQAFTFSVSCAELILLYTESFEVCFFIFTKINCSARQMQVFWLSPGNTGLTN